MQVKLVDRHDKLFQACKRFLQAGLWLVKSLLTYFMSEHLFDFEQNQAFEENTAKFSDGLNYVRSSMFEANKRVFEFV